MAKKAEQEAVEMGKESLTVRIAPGLLRRLRLASGTRTADRIAPYTMSDIVSTCLDTFLKSIGF